jgi:VanZ family protein
MKKYQSVKQIKNFWKTILCIIVIFILSFIPGKTFKKINLFDLSFQDLIVHFIMYAIFTAIFIKDLTLMKKPFFNLKHWWLVPLITSIVLGFITEFVQWLFIPGRNGDILDFLVNLSGTGSIVLFYKKIK